MARLVHRCSYCSAWAETRTELDQHIIALHSPPKPDDPLVRIAIALERIAYHLAPFSSEQGARV